MTYHQYHNLMTALINYNTKYIFDGENFMLHYNPDTELLYATQYGSDKTNDISTWLDELDKNMINKLYKDLHALRDNFSEHIEKVKINIDNIHRYLSQR